MQLGHQRAILFLAYPAILGPWGRAAYNYAASWKYCTVDVWLFVQAKESASSQFSQSATVLMCSQRRGLVGASGD